MPDDLPSSPIQSFRPLPDPTWRERADAVLARLHDLDRPARLVLTIFGVVLAVGVGFIVLRPTAARSAPEDTLPRASVTSTSSSSPTTSPSLVVVQAAGAVVHPGLYRLAHGARVDDLVQAAGGLTLDADADRVNLAAVLADGQKVYVPRVGEAAPAEPSTADDTSSSAQPIDLNTATIAQLETLPGVGPATAQAIVDYRSQHGSFRSVEDLLNVRGIGQAKLDQIRALVRV